LQTFLHYRGANASPVSLIIDELAAFRVKADLLLTQIADGF
jgi:hypothetical protein